MPRRVRIVLPVVHTKSPVPKHIHSVCVACGGRNLVRFGARSQQVQCRSCGVVSPNFNQPKAPRGYSSEQNHSLDKNQASVLLDEMLDALSHEHAKRQLQVLQKKAHGDVPLLCHFYVPYVVDVCAMVTAPYGFSASIDGVKESLRVLQRHATSDDDDQFTSRLIRLRRVVTPTGSWISEDAEAEADNLKKAEVERERQRRLEEEAQRMEKIAAENAKTARIRAKKIALGFDPSVPRLPVLNAEPPRVILAHADARIELRMVARYALQFQWFFQGKELEDSDGCSLNGTVLYTGAQRSTLTLRRLTKRLVGDYYCVCSNEEGVVSSQSTRVQLLTTFGSQRLATRKLKTMPSGGIVALEVGETLDSVSSPSPPSLLATCVGGALLLLHANTLAPAKTIPPLQLPPGTTATAVAWLPSAKLLAVATATHTTSPDFAKVYELHLFAIDMPTAAAATTPAVTSTKSTKHPPSSKPTHQPQPQPLPPQVVLVRPLATHLIPTPLRTVETLRFLENGRTLLVSDRHTTLLVYELTPTALVCKHSVCYDQPTRHPLCHIATTAPVPSGRSPIYSAFVGLAVCRRTCSSVELFNTASGQSTNIRFKLPVQRAAFDREGFTLAAAESGCLKTWISIVSLPLCVKSLVPSDRRKRFVAHVGKMTGLQWTTRSSLLLTCGYDGYVKLWDLEHPCTTGGGEPACVFRLHLDVRGVQSLALIEDSDPIAFVAIGFSDYRAHIRELPQLRAFEVTRCAGFDRAAAQIQKIFKGGQTRDLITKFIRPSV